MNLLAWQQTATLIRIRPAEVRPHLYTDRGEVFLRVNPTGSGPARRTSHAAGSLTALLLTTALVPAAASAQETQSSPQRHPDTAAADTGQLPDIVVTAQRREQKLQDIPLSITAFNAQTLATAGVSSVKELAHVDPSLNFQQAAGVYLPFLRGIGNTAAGTIGNESSVPVYIDDIYYTRLSSAYLGINSIERVEVLKGPQGTLFGRNSSGGAIQIFTKNPSATPEFNATLSYANYDTIGGQIYASTPLTETLGWNIAIAASDQRQGWGKNITTGDDIYKDKFVSVRSKLVWQPTPTTRVKLVGFYAYEYGDIGLTTDLHKGSYGTTPDVPLPGYPNPPARQPSLADAPGDHFYDSRLNGRNFAREEGYGGSLRIDQSLGFADLVSITAFRNGRALYHTDSDYSPQDFYNADLGAVDRQFTQELQLKSISGSRVSWILGAYYLRSSQGYDPARVYGDILNAAVLPGTVQLITSRQIVNSYSLYGQTTAPLASDTNLTLGLRYTSDKVAGIGKQALDIPGVGTVPAAPDYDGHKVFRRLTWKGALDHHFTRALMAYASVSRGYKAGTYNTLPLTSDPALPETVDAYEIGIKSELFGRRVRLNGAVFWNDIQKPQVITFFTNGVTAGVGLTNAQSARIRGAEIGLEALAARGFTLRGAATYLDGKYVRFNPAPIYALSATRLTGPMQGDASGNSLPSVPAWRWDIGANYVAKNGLGKWVGDVGVSYTGAFAWNADNRVIERPVTLVNASLALTPAGLDRVTFSVWGKNLANVKYYSVSQEFAGPAGIGGDIAAPAPPLTFGGSVSVKF